MNIIEAFQKLDSHVAVNSFVTNGFLKRINRYLKYVGNGKFYEFEWDKISERSILKDEISTFPMAYILSTDWESLNMVNINSNFE